MTNSIGMKLALVPPGKFNMGSSDADAEASPDQKPLHQVSITRPFFLGTAEVTRGQFAAFVRATDYKTEAERDGKGGVAFDDSVRDWRQDTKYSWRNPGFDQDDSHPVVNVSWNDATAFCDWLSRKEKKTYRLPTEAEWEYACRAGTETRYYSGDADVSLRMIANLSGLEDGYRFTSPVGSLRANVFGLFDMSGNVVEWCRDFYGGDYYSKSPSEDPVGPASSFGRVCRGGSWFNPPGACRSAARRALSAGLRISDIGFRVALSIEGAPNATANAETVKPNAPQLLVAPFDEATARQGQEAWAAHLHSPVEDTNTIGMKFRLVPPGEFIMGSLDSDHPSLYASAKPPHKVRITRPFYLGANEVTRGQFAEFVKATGYKTEAEESGRGSLTFDPITGKTKFDPKLNWRSVGYPQDDRHPVVDVTWNDAQAFCKWLSKKEGTIYRLPSEAEWEYACRAGTTTRFLKGDREEDLVAVANVNGKEWEEYLTHKPSTKLPDGYIFTAPVGSFLCNNFGLFDTLGNVWEWCHDIESAYTEETVVDPIGPTTGANRACRGGGIDCGLEHCRPATRGGEPASTAAGNLGFRVACDVDAGTAASTQASANSTTPDGFVRLFNGKDTTGWSVESGDANAWTVEQGTIVARGEKYDTRNYLLTDREYGDFILRVEFNFEPGAASGILLRAVPHEKVPFKGRPIFDHPVFKLLDRPGAGEQTGTTNFLYNGVYIQPDRGAQMLPAGSWNQLEIEVKGRSMRAWVNRNLIIDRSIDAEALLSDGTIPGLNRTKGRIGLQKHTSTVRFRNIEIRELPANQANSNLPLDGFVPLFNGKDLIGWNVYPDGTGDWKVEDGILIGSGPLSHLFSKRGDYQNFRFRVEAQINDHGNSGQYFRTQFGPGFPKGYEAQINSTHRDPIKTGSLYGFKKTEVREMLVPPGEWFTQEVTAIGNHIVIKVNGKTTVDYKVTDPNKTFFQGHFALQQHDPGTVVKFRKIEVLELPPASGKRPALPLTPAHEKATTATPPPTFKNALGMEFVLVPEGKSWLGGGGGKPGDKEVVIAQDFYLGKYEVTQEEWEKVTGLTPSWFSRTGPGKDVVKDITDAELKRFPVDSVSWHDAQVFLKRLNKGEKEAGWFYRLPKEAEWEYACRGGPLSDKAESAYDFYFDKPTNQLLPEQANFGHWPNGPTCKVGSYKPNQLGLYDMHGNVEEWCDDAEKTAHGASNRVRRGCSWGCYSDGCPTAGRSVGPPSAPSSRMAAGYGLRVARVPVRQRVNRIWRIPPNKPTAHR
ncbi:MAG TPA: SUMF1/EgtB/PvdO family nonheme iron enzyme [Planctomycetaceae bacterium]|jgi:formylglycine-generating enzyme required for sulfatase activity|nr:SUMF1/EgtB/PvdO family nonheme iron enzyme [Planctomycetaceae bacterium]